MTKLKQWVALTVVAALALAAGGWFLLVSPKRAEAADLTGQATAQDGTNSGLRNKLAVLKAQSVKLPAEQAKLAAVSTKIPANPALPALIYSLTAASDAAGVQFLSLTPGQPTAQAKPAAPAVKADGTTAPAAKASTLQTIPVAISVNGGYFETEQFLAALEDLPRAFRVTVLGVAPGDNPLAPKSKTSGAAGAPSAASSTVLDGSKLTSTITAEIYMSGPITIAPVRARAGPAAAATPGAPAAAGAPATGASPLPGTSPVPVPSPTK